MISYPKDARKEVQLETDGTPRDRDERRLAQISLAALGVVFGDIGTSPLYALRECFHGAYGIAVSDMNILGVLSLMFWALIIIVTIKYMVFILRADNHGEGGVLALTALIRAKSPRKNLRWALVATGLFGASLLYGDGVITPAISVLSAIEGIGIITPVFMPYIVPATLIILASLFLVQGRGTERIGTFFGPIILVWFSVIGSLGFVAVARNPKILASVLPWHAFDFLLKNQRHGFLVLGAVFLVVTGAEALYADMGHFGKKPIRLIWVALVLPALLLNYFGQGAILLSRPDEAHHPFYALVPAWGLVPMVILATTATIIASQAVVSGAFSLTHQAIQLGYLPRLKIVHTSARLIGQVYVPLVNWFLMAATIGLVIGFRSSSKLAAAYGIAVTSTMLISTVLFYAVARERWRWSRLAAGCPALLFLVVDLSFFGANIAKILHGGWFPLAMGGIIFGLMVIWNQGRNFLAGQLRAKTSTYEEFQRKLADNPPHRIDGQAVFLTGNPDMVPWALLHNLAHNKILHSEIAFLHFSTEEIPRVPNNRKVEITRLGGGFYKILARYGFKEEPRISTALVLAQEKGLNFKMEKTSFFLGHQRLFPRGASGMGLLPAWIFFLLSRNALDAATYFHIPSDQVFEVGIQLDL